MKIQRRITHGRLAPAMPARRLPGAPSLRAHRCTTCRATVKTTARRRSF